MGDGEGVGEYVGVVASRARRCSATPCETVTPATPICKVVKGGRAQAERSVRQCERVAGEM